MFSFMSRLGFWVLGQEDHRGKVLFLSHHSSMSNCYWCWPWSLAEGVLVFVLHYESLFAPFPCFPLWQEVILHRPPLRSGKLCSLFWGQNTHVSCLGFFYKRFSSSFHLFFSVIYLYQCEFMDICFVYTTLFCCSNFPALSIGGSFRWLPIPFDILSSL